MTGTDNVAGALLDAGTDAGMFALWNPARFAAIDSYEAWEDALLEDEDIARHIRAGDLVPVNIGADGAFGFAVRTGPSETTTLTSRERRYLGVSSQPYLYRSAGTACLSGIEHIWADPGPDIATLVIPAGPWAVTIHLIDWAAEPGARDQHGRPGPTALPDFVMLICPPEGDISYRTELQTFVRPGG
jgi:hypothetical protein